jgi:hypothetical protein
LDAPVPPDFQDVFAALAARIQSYGIRIVQEKMDAETAGKFDGPSITINTAHDLEARCYYLAHSFGSIVRWSIASNEAQHTFSELRRAKAVRDRDPERFERALERFAAFEEGASEHAVWLLADIGYAGVIEGYTRFFRADLDAMRIYHRKGVAPRWPEFFAEWQATVARQGTTVAPYCPRAVPSFAPVRIEEQEVLQERDGRP